ncbi:hypothetical protein AYI68_g3219 [Smittium mucronatum]|uniref:EXPERA domain-containing protein n=1 Tax=Smittium mucronatum TaxID=133383 RepID=A0A1R0H0I9_9FUNG|nr:hypothetical protein AYI68_g3219 [Smittium mucronatum]
MSVYTATVKVYCVLHLVFAALTDMIPVIPEQYLFGFQIFLNDQVNAISAIDLMERPATKSVAHLSWFHSMLIFEILFQVPVLILILMSLSGAKNGGKSNSLYKYRHLLQVIYGTHVATTMIPVLGYIYSVIHTVPLYNQVMLALMYVPFAAMPLIMAVVGTNNLLAQIDSSGRQKKRN